MIPCFCDPYPDEVLYSVWARYGDRVHYPYKREVLQELFGRTNIRAILDFPGHLKHFVDKLPFGHEYSVDFFIDHHTLLPFYGAFFPELRLLRIRERMSTGSTTSIHWYIGVLQSRIPSPPWLRYCPVCITEERAQFGEGYWHRLHQVAGVEICPLHQTFLEKTTILTRGNENGIGLVSAETAIGPIQPTYATSSPFFKVFMSIAQEASYLLEHPFLFRDPHAFFQRYRLLLAQHGFMTSSGSIRVHDFLKAFTEYYPQELLCLLHCEITGLDRPARTWVAKLTYGSARIFHPLYHILICHFLASTLEKSHRQDSPLPSPIDDGPWPCLNPVCEYSHQSSYQTGEVSVKGTVPGRFTCTCGSTSARLGPDLSPDDLFQTERVLSYGPVWEAKLRELWSDPLVSFQSLASHLGVDKETAQKQAALLNLPARGSFSDPPLAETSLAGKKKDRSWYRAQWLTILEEAPCEPLHVLQRRAKGVYSWLVRNDQDWFAAHRPPRRSGSRPTIAPDRLRENQQDMDHIRHDALVADAVRSAACHLITLEDRPVRVTRSKIIVAVPEVRRVRVGMDKLPLTTQALQEVVETREAFALRRIRWARDRYLEERSCPRRWQFLERAGLRGAILQIQTVVQAFEDAIDTLSPFI